MRQTSRVGVAVIADLSILGATIAASPATLAQQDNGLFGEAGPDFDARQYLGQGDRFNCVDFDSQAEAQAVLRADPTDPNLLDRDGNGVACENNVEPYDLRRVPR
jgi:Excalibur calcium-binding domain